MRFQRMIVGGLAGLAGLVLASCASDTTGPAPLVGEKPFMQTDPGTLPVTGKEPYSPDSPGYDPAASGSAIRAAEQ